MNPTPFFTGVKCLGRTVSFDPHRVIAELLSRFPEARVNQDPKQHPVDLLCWLYRCRLGLEVAPKQAAGMLQAFYAVGRPIPVLVSEWKGWSPVNVDALVAAARAAAQPQPHPIQVAVAVAAAG